MHNVCSHARTHTHARIHARTHARRQSTFSFYISIVRGSTSIFCGSTQSRVYIIIYTALVAPRFRLDSRYAGVLCKLRDGVATWRLIDHDKRLMTLVREFLNHQVTKYLVSCFNRWIISRRTPILGMAITTRVFEISSSQFVRVNFCPWHQFISRVTTSKRETGDFRGDN